MKGQMNCSRNSICNIYIPKEESKGGNHARNTGILSAKGKYVAFLDNLSINIKETIERYSDYKNKCENNKTNLYNITSWKAVAPQWKKYTKKCYSINNKK